MNAELLPPNLPELLSAYLDQSLSDAERQEVEAQLARSAEARQVLDDLRMTRALVQALPVLHVPRSFTLDAEQYALPARRGFRWSVFAAVLPVLVIGFLFWQVVQPVPMEMATFENINSGLEDYAAAPKAQDSTQMRSMPAESVAGMTAADTVATAAPLTMTALAALADRAPLPSATAVQPEERGVGAMSLSQATSGGSSKAIDEVSPLPALPGWVLVVWLVVLLVPLGYALFRPRRH